MKQIKLIELWRRNTSKEGNPSFYVSFTDEEGKRVYSAYTGCNCSCGYSIQNFKFGDTIKAEYHFTRSGNCIITKIN